MKLNTAPKVMLADSVIAIPTPAPNAEKESKEEMSEVLLAFKERAKREQQRYWDAVDSEYYTVLCFQTRAQRDEFLEKAGLLNLGDRGERYLDGLKVAEILGIPIDSPTPTMPKLRKCPKDMAKLVLNT